MMWDLRGNDAFQDRRRSPNPSFPMPSPGIQPERYPTVCMMQQVVADKNDYHRDLHRSHDPFPRPFEPLGLPNAPRSVSPK
ncbi:hypothetical protein BDR03DRAFT_974117, partial [Suillus americanus]